MNLETQSGLLYLERKAQKDSEKAPIIIFLHGYGSHEGDLFSFAPELGPQYHIFSLRAPYNLPWGGHCWYNLEFDQTGSVRKGNLEEGHQSIQKIKKFMDSLDTDQQVILMGFSQGAILSYALAFHFPEKIAGIAALSGYLQKELLPEKQILDKISHLKIYMTHGTEDAVIPVEMPRQTSQFFVNQNITHIYKEYKVGHGIDAPMFHELKEWLNENFI